MCIVACWIPSGSRVWLEDGPCSCEGSSPVWFEAPKGADCPEHGQCIIFSTISTARRWVVKKTKPLLSLSFRLFPWIGLGR
jgi:hypothetical protein